MSTSVPDVGRRLRALLLEPRPSPSNLEGALNALSALVSDLCSSTDDAGRKALEVELQVVYGDVLAKSSDTRHIALWLAVLNRASPALSAGAIVTDWWEGVLRPALRTPRLAPVAVAHAKAVVLAALHHRASQHSRLVSDFRRRLLDLYLRDAPHDSGGAPDDLQEWAATPAPERAMRIAWRAQLEAILVAHAAACPADVLDEVHDDFVRKPAHRLRLLGLLDACAAQPWFAPDATPILAGHPLTGVLLKSLQFDKAPTACAVTLALVVKLLPMFAVHAPDRLKALVPRLLRVLAHLVCLPAGSTTDPLEDSSKGTSSSGSSPLMGSPEDGLYAAPSPLPGNEEILWRKLDEGHDPSSTAPSPYRLFTFLYYLFPCNVIRFLRSPVDYLDGHGMPNPRHTTWADELDEVQIKSLCEPILRAHIVHPRLIWADAKQELGPDARWEQLSVAQIVGEATMLDVRHAGLAARQREAATTAAAAPKTGPGTPEDEVPSPPAEPGTTPRARPMDIPGARALHHGLEPVLEERSDPHDEPPVVSVQALVATALLLKSGRDVTIAGPSNLIPSTLVKGQEKPDVPHVSTPAHSRRGSHETSAATDANADAEDVLSRALALAASLQRDAVLLRAELNLELWLNRENVKHVGRLHEEHVLSRNAEVERQALHNRLRQYKKTVSDLEKTAASHRQAAAHAHEKAQKWSLDLQSKLQVRREEIRRWDSQTAALRAENVDLKAKLEAQSRLLEEAKREVFQLETRIKETAHKVDRLRDYEKRIAQLTTTQQLWDEDVQKLKDQKEALSLLLGERRKLQLRVEAHEQNEGRLVEQLRIAHERVQTLEAERGTRLTTKSPEHDFAKEIAAAASARARLDKANATLRERVASMEDEMETLRFELEEVRAAAGMDSAA